MRYTAFAYDADDRCVPAADASATIMHTADTLDETRTWAEARFAPDGGRYVSRVRVFETRPHHDYDRDHAVLVIDNPRPNNP